MIRLLSHKTGMTTMEYVILISVIFLALLAMQTTLRRAVSSRWKDAADSFGSGRQYEEGVSTVTVN
jgi:Flp pilus assembly pilin Flp